jgi:hypothetical protein
MLMKLRAVLVGLLLPVALVQPSDPMKGWRALCGSDFQFCV